MERKPSLTPVAWDIDQRLPYTVVAECRMGIEVLGTVAAEQPFPLESLVVTLGGLQKALRGGHPIIFCEISHFGPSFFKIFMRVILILTLIAFFYDYNIEIYQKTLVKGVELSFGVKFTKPRP